MVGRGDNGLSPAELTLPLVTAYVVWGLQGDPARPPLLGRRAHIEMHPTVAGGRRVGGRHRLKTGRVIVPVQGDFVPGAHHHIGLDLHAAPRVGGILVERQVCRGHADLAWRGVDRELQIAAADPIATEARVIANALRVDVVKRPGGVGTLIEGIAIDVAAGSIGLGITPLPGRIQGDGEVAVRVAQPGMIGGIGDLKVRPAARKGDLHLR